MAGLNFKEDHIPIPAHELCLSLYVDRKKGFVVDVVVVVVVVVVVFNKNYTYVIFRNFVSSYLYKIFFKSKGH